jgi:hypothetical protein
VAERVARVDWKQVVEDVRPFLEKAAETSLLTRETFARLLAG